jgi:Zn-dependent peptidase ImmA (M78 family)
VKQLIRKANTYGLAVHGVEMKGGKVGRYVPALRRIYFDLGLTLAGRRTVIAHELGHAHYGHDHDSPKNERLADAYAAALLVEPEWYVGLERINDDAEWIAEEMTVEPYVILDYRRYCLQRIRSVTYSGARMGAGQWRHRVGNAEYA